VNETIETDIERRGFLLILSSPSGAGKTTLTRLLLERDPSLSLSVSVTTRPPRANEIEGVHYFFVAPDRFAEMRDRGELLEWAEVFGRNYGTPRAPVETMLAQGRDMVFDIDWQGCRTLSALMPEECVRVFILPPSRAELERRIRNRGTDAPQVIEARLLEADEEMAHWREYDYVIVNSDLGQSLDCLMGIVRAERCRRARLGGLPGFVNGLMREIR
jgi:guanylate kinase